MVLNTQKKNTLKTGEKDNSKKVCMKITLKYCSSLYPREVLVSLIRGSQGLKLLSYFHCIRDT